MSSDRGYCEWSRSVGFDPTGEKGVLCNAPADYCSLCEQYVCSECHRDVHKAEQPVKKLPATAADMTRRVREAG